MRELRRCPSCGHDNPARLHKCEECRSSLSGTVPFAAEKEPPLEIEVFESSISIQDDRSGGHFKRKRIVPVVIITGALLIAGGLWIHQRATCIPTDEAMSILVLAGIGMIGSDNINQLPPETRRQAIRILGADEGDFCDRAIGRQIQLGRRLGEDAGMQRK